MKYYGRGEDAERTTVTEVGDGGLFQKYVASRDCGNPSSRRHGLAIGFYCEMCGAEDLELTLAQHKGNTHLGWRRSTETAETGPYNRPEPLGSQRPRPAALDIAKLLE